MVRSFATRPARLKQLFLDGRILDLDGANTEAETMTHFVVKEAMQAGPIYYKDWRDYVLCKVTQPSIQPIRSCHCQVSKTGRVARVNVGIERWEGMIFEQFASAAISRPMLSLHNHSCPSTASLELMVLSPESLVAEVQLENIWTPGESLRKTCTFFPSVYLSFYIVVGGCSEGLPVCPFNQQ